MRDEMFESVQELTDEELAMVAGGMSKSQAWAWTAAGLGALAAGAGAVATFSPPVTPQTAGLKIFSSALAGLAGAGAAYAGGQALATSGSTQPASDPTMSGH